MSESLCKLHIQSRPSIDLVSGLVDSSAEMLGLGAAARIRLQALTLEVLVAVVQDAFADTEEIDLEVEAMRTAGALKIVLRDRGAPLNFGAGGYPPRVADLIRLGFADGLEFANEGRAGNLTTIAKSLKFKSVDDEFIAETKASPSPEPVLDSDGKAEIEVRAMTTDDVVGVARLFYRCYGYSAAYAPVVYQPDRLRELIEDGLHIATVAVAPDGTIVGHVATHVRTAEAKVGEVGLYAVDPRYRKLGVGMKLSLGHAARLFEGGFNGQFARAVTVHNRSQKAALMAGGKEMGVTLAAQPGDLQFRGFDADDQYRKAVVTFYTSFGGTPERTVYVPQTYADIVTRIYEHANLPRTVVSGFEREPQIEAEFSVFNVRLGSETGLSVLEVQTFGRDFLESLQAQVRQLRLNRFGLIVVAFPLGDPLTAHFAAGLHELGLSFSAILPEYDNGDVLWLQSLNNVDFLPDQVRVASEFGEFLRDFVVDDLQAAMNLQETRDRSRAAMSRIYEALT